jgi:hypothetical protein
MNANRQTTLKEELDIALAPDLPTYTVLSTCEPHAQGWREFITDCKERAEAWADETWGYVEFFEGEVCTWSQTNYNPFEPELEVEP